MRTPLLELRNLNAGHDRQVVLKEISHGLDQGQLVCLIGPNGSGKSTLINTLAGIIPPIGGEVFYKGELIDQRSSSWKARFRALVQAGSPIPALFSVFEFVAMGRAPHTGRRGIPGMEDRRIIQESLEMTGMTPFEERIISRLSDGEKQKARLARALCQNTELIILDEPTNFLDLPAREEILDLLKKLTREHHKTILFSSHDVEAALLRVDCVWTIDYKGSFKSFNPEELNRERLYPLYRGC